MNKLERKLWADHTVAGRLALLDYLTEQDRQDTDDDKRCRAELCLLTIYTKALSYPDMSKFKPHSGITLKLTQSTIALWPTKKIITIAIIDKPTEFIVLTTRLFRGMHDKYLTNRLRADLKYLKILKVCKSGARWAQQLESYVPGTLIEKP